MKPQKRCIDCELSQSLNTIRVLNASLLSKAISLNIKNIYFEHLPGIVIAKYSMIYDIKLNLKDVVDNIANSCFGILKVLMLQTFYKKKARESDKELLKDSYTFSLKIEKIVSPAGNHCYGITLEECYQDKINENFSWNNMECKYLDELQELINECNKNPLDMNIIVDLGILYNHLKIKENLKNVIDFYEPYFKNSYLKTSNSYSYKIILLDKIFKDFIKVLIKNKLKDQRIKGFLIDDALDVFYISKEYEDYYSRIVIRDEVKLENLENIDNLGKDDLTKEFIESFKENIKPKIDKEPIKIPHKNKSFIYTEEFKNNLLTHSQISQKDLKETKEKIKEIRNKNIL